MADATQEAALTARFQQEAAGNPFSLSGLISNPSDILNNAKSALSFAKIALSGQTVTEDEIKKLDPKARDGLIQMILGMTGSKSVENLLEKNMPAIKDHLRNNPEQILKFLKKMDPEKLKAEFLKLPDEVKAPLQRQIEAQRSAILDDPNMTYKGLLDNAGIKISGLPEGILNQKLGELDLKSLSNDQIMAIVPQLPKEMFNPIFNKINNILPVDKQVSLGTPPDQAKSFAEVIDRASTYIDNNGLKGNTFAYSWTISKEEAKDGIFNAIRNPDPKELKESVRATLDAIKKQTIELDKLPASAFSDFIRDEKNKQILEDMLKNEKNWASIEKAITLKMLMDNQKEVLDAFVPQMTVQSMAGFRQLLEILPVEFRKFIKDTILPAIESCMGHAESLTRRLPAQDDPKTPAIIKPEMGTAAAP